jgi:hypothetical protein
VQQLEIAALLGRQHVDPPQSRQAAQQRRRHQLAIGEMQHRQPVDGRSDEAAMGARRVDRQVIGERPQRCAESAHRQSSRSRTIASSSAP